jgi:hypothetical protein
MSKQLSDILGRATRATPVTGDVVAMPIVPMPSREPDIPMQVRIPESVKRQIEDKAHERRITVRAYLLEVLKAAGIEVAEIELRDRRK